MGQGNILIDFLEGNGLNPTTVEVSPVPPTSFSKPWKESDPQNVRIEVQCNFVNLVTRKWENREATGW